MSRYGFGQSIAIGMLGSILMLLAPSYVSAAGPGVHGRVLGHDEQGKFLGIVGGAKIEIQNRGGAKVGQTTADKNGYFKIDLPPGEYLYKIEADGYRKEDAGRGMRLTQSEGYSIFNLALTKGQDDPNRTPPEIPPKKIGKLRGRVLEKTTNAERGIPEARIALRREGSRELAIVRTRATADDQHQAGDYEVTLEAGRYRASVMASGFETFTDPDLIEIKPGEDTQRDFVLSRSEPEDIKGQGIRGVVTIIDSGATPPPIKIQIVPLGVGRPSPIDVQTSSNVAFSRELPPGRYRVTASAEGFPTASSPPAYVFEGRYTLVNLALRAEKVPEPKTTIEVFVYTKPAGTDESIPLSGATVSLLKTGADPLSAKESRTNSTGHAIFSVTEAGEYAAEAHLKGYRAGSGKGVVELGHSHEVGIELVKEAAPPAEIALNAVISDAATKRPLAGARVLARHQDQTLAEAARGVSDAKGEAALEVTRTGSYAVVAQLPGYEPGGEKTEVRSGQANRVAISLRSTLPPSVEPQPPPPTEDESKRAVVNGYVAYREASGQLRSVSDTKLVWERIALNQPAFTQFATTGRAGRYQVELLPGHYQVRVEPPAGFEPVIERFDAASGTHEKYFLVHRSEKPIPPPSDTLVDVTGNVVTETSGGRFAGVANAEILFARTEGVAKADSGGGGSFSMRLAEDRYRVHVRAKGYEPLDTSADVRSTMTPLRFVLKRSTEPSTGFALNIVVVERQLRAAAGIVQPVRDAQVQISQDGRPLSSGATDSAGRYSLRVKPGTFTISVGKRGFVKAAADVEVSNRDVTEQILLKREEAPEPTPADLELNLSVVERSRSRRAAGQLQPVAGAQVQIALDGRSFASGTTSSSGRYSARVKPGTYNVRILKANYNTATATISVAGRDVTQQIVLAGKEEPGPDPTHKPTLTVRVARRSDRPPMTIKPSGSPLSGAQITVMRGSKPVASGQTNASGIYSVQLPPGSYAVKAFAQGYAPSGKTIVMTDRDAAMDFQLEQTPSGASASASTDGTGKPDSSSSGRGPRDRPAERPPQTWYTVEHRDNAQSPWVELDRFRTQREAQYALFRAVERGQIAGAAPAESRIRTVTIAGSSDDRRRRRE